MSSVFERDLPISHEFVGMPDTIPDRPMKEKLQELMRGDGRSKLLNAFRYLEALNDRRNPPPLNIDRYDYRLNLLTLPDHPCVQRGEAFVLKVTRPPSTPCPTPPPTIRQRLADGWEKPLTEPKLKDLDPSILQLESEKNEEDLRGREYQSWLRLWNQWALIR